jgi:hypothetical protein
MSRGGWKDWLLGGWDGAWTQTYQSGPPVTVTFDGSPYKYLQGNRRPDQILTDAQLFGYRHGSYAPSAGRAICLLRGAHAGLYLTRRLGRI